VLYLPLARFHIVLLADRKAASLPQNGHFESPMPTPTIVCFTLPEGVAPSLAEALQSLGWEKVSALGWVESAEQFPQLQGEPLLGNYGAWVRFLAETYPVLLVVQMEDFATWRDWVAIAKSTAATRRIPVLALHQGQSPRTPTHIQEQAKQVGVDQLLDVTSFNKLTSLHLQAIARLPNRSAICDACEKPLPALALSGIRAFNRGEYYAAHDDLEAAWVEEANEVREMYRAILQIGIAFHQIQRGNLRGAAKMFLRAKQWFAILPDQCQGLDLAQLRDCSQQAEQYLLTLLNAPHLPQTFPQALFPKISFISAAPEALP